MGGESNGNFSIQNNLGIFQGEVVDVPDLGAPGFIRIMSSPSNQAFPDISSCENLALIVKSYVNYSGYYVSLG